MKNKLAKCFVAAAAIGMAAAEEGGTPAPGYLAGLQALSEKRIPMKQAVVARCSIDAVLSDSPHLRADMVVHANRALLDYISKNREGLAFPVGSVLLKEKFRPGDPKSAAILITRMERVAAAGTVKDWTFSATSFEKGKPTKTEEAPSRCVACHEDFEVTSFVSPDSVKLLREYASKAPIK